MDNKIKYWVELSDYDLDTAAAMLESGRYLYVGFMCHQATEKILKALFTKINNSTPPFSHSLSLLAEKCSIFNELTSQQVDFITNIEPMNTEARYPTFKDELFKSLSGEVCQKLINQTKEFQLWVKTKL